MTGSVRIAIDSTEILYKVVEIPYMKPAEIQEVIRREFDNIDSQYEEQIYDYSVLEGRAAEGKNGRILCCAMGRPMLESYKTLFKNAGIPLKSCDMRLNCVLKALRLLPELQKGRFVLSFVEQEKMINYLIADGQFLFTNRMFLNSHADAEGAAAELMGNISTINQFYKSEKGDVFLERAYLHGVEAAVLQKCQPFAEGMKLQLTALPQSTQITCKRESDPPFLFGDYLIAAGCLLGK